LACLVMASMARQPGTRHPVGHVKIGDGYMQVMSKHMFGVLFAQVALIGMDPVRISRIGRIKNPDRKGDVTCRDRGTLDPLTLVVQREHHYCFYLMAVLFPQSCEKQADPNR